MTFTGTTIEELIATVERAEARAQADVVELEAWYVSVHESANYDSNILGVA
jgi:hypothetical protein